MTWRHDFRENRIREDKGAQRKCHEAQESDFAFTDHGRAKCQKKIKLDLDFERVHNAVEGRSAQHVSHSEAVIGQNVSIAVRERRAFHC